MKSTAPQSTRVLTATVDSSLTDRLIPGLVALAVIASLALALIS